MTGSPDPIQTPPVNRRELLAAAGGLGLVAFAGRLATAGDRAGEYVPPGLERDLPPEAGRLPRASFLTSGPFDLSDPREYALARTKAMINLVGRTAWLAVLTRHTLCPPGRPAVPLANELELFTMWHERTPEGDVQRNIFTRVPLDPRTNRPTYELENPLTGNILRLPDTLFALTLPVRLGGDLHIRDTTEAAQPWFHFGAYLDLVSLAVRGGDGPHQPSLDSSVWRVRHDELMDPERPLVDAHYSQSALVRASLVQWTGYEPDDPTQMLISKSGLKVNAREALPEAVHSWILDKYPERA